MNGGSIAVGFGISVTDPFIIALWVALSGSYLIQFSTPMALLNIFFIPFGFLVFFIPVAIAVKLKKDMIPFKFVAWFSRISGVVLLATAMTFIYALIAMA